MLYCGIDWSWEQLTLFIIDDKGNAIEDFVINNDLDGFMYALSTFRHVCKGHDIIFAIETSNQRVIDFLISYDYKVYLINSNSMDKFRNRYKTSGVKSDSFDAFVIANVLRTDISTLNEVAADDQLTQELGMVLRDRESLIELKTRLSNQLRDSLRLYFPGPQPIQRYILYCISAVFRGFSHTL
jgi:transposase